MQNPLLTGGGAVLIEEKDLNPEGLLAEVMRLKK